MTNVDDIGAAPNFWQALPNTARVRNSLFGAVKFSAAIAASSSKLWVSAIYLDGDRGAAPAAAVTFCSYI